MRSGAVEAKRMRGNAFITIVAVKNEIIVGFGDIDKTGYLDRLYVHKDYQRQGIASAICDELERRVNAKSNRFLGMEFL